MKKLIIPGEFFAFITISLWSTNALISAHISHIAPIEISFFRWLIAFLCLLPISFKSIKGHPRALLNHWKFFLTLALCLVIENAFFYNAGHTTDAVNISLFSASMPLFLLLFEALFMKNSLTVFQVMGIIIAAISVMYAILHGDFKRLASLSFKVGDLYALGSVFFLSLYTFLQRRKAPSISVKTFLFILSGCIGLLNFPAFMYHEIQTRNLFSFNLTEVYILLYLGIGISLISYLFWEMATQKIGPLKTGFIHYFSIPVTALLNFIILGIPISRFQVISCLGIILSSVLMNKKVKKVG